MKVAMMGSWNTDSGAAIHAELLGRALVDKGIDLKVFSFYRHSFHGTAFTKNPDEEESYVTRCFTVYNVPNEEMNTSVILAEDFDVFVVEDLGMIPMRPLLDIYPQIKKRAKTVNIIHDGELSDKPEFFRFDWDHVVCFDDRYRDFLKNAYQEAKISVIPFPSYPLKIGDKVEAREELGLPKEKKIVLFFGPSAVSAVNVPVVLDRLSEKYDIMGLLVTEAEAVLGRFNRIMGKTKFEMRVIEKAPSTDLLYKYLHASDCVIYDKESVPRVVVSSTIFQCLGAGCPFVAYDSNYTHSFSREILKYDNYYELEENIVDIFEKGRKYHTQQQAMVSFLEENSASVVADKFIALFDILLKREG